MTGPERQGVESQNARLWRITGERMARQEPGVFDGIVLDLFSVIEGHHQIDARGDYDAVDAAIANPSAVKRYVREIASDHPELGFGKDLLNEHWPRFDLVDATHRKDNRKDPPPPPSPKLITMPPPPTFRDEESSSVRKTPVPEPEKGIPGFDPVEWPCHYASTRIQPIEVIEDWALGFCLGNAVKYICRADKKGTKLQDLEKARWYLNREIARLEAEEE